MLRTQNTSDPRHFSISAGTSAELYRHIGTMEDISAPDNTGPSHGNGGRLYLHNNVN